jgi:hypothetical protein
MPPFLLLSNEVTTVKIIFEFNQSPKWDELMKLCETVSTFSSHEEANSKIYSLVLPITKISILVEIGNIVENWKNSKLFFNNKPTHFDSLKSEDIVCYHNQQNQENRDDWCFGKESENNNIWGCIQLHMPFTEEGAPWLNHGRFDKSGVWYFNKKIINKELEKRAKKIKNCPVFKNRKPREELSTFPDSVNPKYDKSWSYFTKKETIQGQEKEMPMGVKPQFKEGEGFILNNGYQNLSFSDFNNESSSIKSNDFLSDQEKEEKYGIPDEKPINGLVLLFGFTFLILIIYIISTSF